MDDDHERDGSFGGRRLDRRSFLSGATALGAAASLYPLGGLAVPNQAFTFAGERLAVTMWDFSWLTRRTAPEAEYADFDRALDELAERGYNCVRMDAFPHLIAKDAGGRVQERFTVLPQDPAFMWGNHANVEVEPRKSIIEFMRKLKTRGMRAGFSSWFQNDASDRTSMVVTPEDFARVWSETLEWVGEHDLLDVVEWVDLCNEFPLEMWAPGALRYMAETTGEPIGILSAVQGYSEAQKSALGDFMRESIEGVRARFPDLAYCYSFTAADAGLLDGVDLGGFDVLEPHLWINANIPFTLLSGLWATLAGIPQATYAIYPHADFHYRAGRQRWLEWLGRMMDTWTALSRKYEAPLYTSESWGPVNWADLSPKLKEREWDWVKDVCAEGVSMAVERGWKGVCSSNFCGPQHEGMWNDVEWHRGVTNIISG